MRISDPRLGSSSQMRPSNGTRLEASSITKYPDGSWEYEGAERGFLAQNLIPTLLKPQGWGNDGLPVHSELEIMSVSGTYGEFEGADALCEYRKEKAFWEGLGNQVFETLWGIGVLPYQQSSGDRGEFTAIIVHAIKSNGWNSNYVWSVPDVSEGRVMKLMDHPVVHSTYGRCLDRFPSEKNLRMTKKQFAQIWAMAEDREHSPI